jgi:DNA polymerase-3 subunit epsilon
MRQYMGISFNHSWLDLAYVMPALNPDFMRNHRSLDDWSALFDIRNDDRHNAVADALATAQLLLVAIAQARSINRVQSYDGLRGLERRLRSKLENY